MKRREVLKILGLGMTGLTMGMKPFDGPYCKPSISDLIIPSAEAADAYAACNPCNNKCSPKNCDPHCRPACSPVLCEKQCRPDRPCKPSGTCRPDSTACQPQCNPNCCNPKCKPKNCNPHCSPKCLPNNPCKPCPSPRSLEAE